VAMMFLPGQPIGNSFGIVSIERLHGVNGDTEIVVFDKPPFFLVAAQWFESFLSSFCLDIDAKMVFHHKK